MRGSAAGDTEEAVVSVFSSVLGVVFEENFGGIGGRGGAEEEDGGGGSAKFS